MSSVLSFRTGSGTTSDWFLRYKRQKGCTAVDHVNTFEHLLFEAELHGMRLNNILKTTMLLESAGLTEEQEGWCLQPVMGDYAQYDTIRTAFRRLALDGAHKTLEGYPVAAANEHGAQERTHGPSLNLNATQLQRPPAESLASASTDLPSNGDGDGDDAFSEVLDLYTDDD